MHLNKLVGNSENLFIEFTKLGVSRPRLIETFELSLNEHFPKIKDKFTDKDFNISTMKYNNINTMTYEYSAKITIHNNLKQLFITHYPESVI
jgi:hypothetical protein